MSDNNEKGRIVDIGDQSVNQDAESNRETASADELKQQAGELLKAAGGLAGSLGKYAIKKGSQIKEKLEDEEFQEKVNKNIKAVTDKIDDYVSSDSAKNRRTVSVKGSTEEANTSYTQAVEKSQSEKAVKENEIETSFEVEGKETVNFETKKPTRGIAKAIEQGKAERKAEKERKRAEKERKRKEQQKQSMMAALFLLGIAIICMVMANISKSGHEGQIHAPLSSLDAYELNYEDVIKQFEDAGFTNVDTMKMEDLVVGWLSSDGGVEKITINGEEDYESDSWYEPNVKVLVYYHTYSPEAQEEKAEENTEGEDSEVETETAPEQTPEPEKKVGRIDEMAFRAAVVALTNSLAADVFDDNDGNAHDPSKYHSYADRSGEGTMDIMSDGYWTKVADNKWHVDSIKLKNKYDVVADASLDVEYDGSVYRISNITGTFVKPGLESYGVNDLSIATDPKYLTNDTALEVPESLISKDR